MKKLSVFIIVVLVNVFFYGCSENSTSSQQSETVTKTEISISNDTLSIYFKVSGTTYTFSQKDSLLFFSTFPKVKYDVTLSSGSGDIFLYTSDSSSVYNKHFSANVKDSSNLLPFIPKKYYFSLNNFTGTGTIKAMRSN